MMCKILRTVRPFLVVACVAAACELRRTEYSEPKARLGWEENFTGRRLDSSRWSKIPRGGADWSRHMSNNPKLYDVRGGKLVLHGMKGGMDANDTAAYVTGGIYSKGKAAFGLGRLEIRAKLQAAKSAWPALWMLPEGAQWPLGGEIDIMERLNHDAFVYQTVHNNYTLHVNENKPPHSAKMAIKPKRYNVYAVERHADSLVFFVNGKRSFGYARLRPEAEEQFPFSDHKFYLLLDMQVGGSWVGRASGDELPVAMYIDWVRFYPTGK